MTELGPVLTRLGLSQYLQSFLEEGFDTWETVLEVTESDLDALNVKLGHRRRLQREISDTVHLLAEKAAASASRTTPYEGIVDITSSVGTPEHRPGCGSGKRKYRRHPKPDEHAPERPPSAYVIFSNKTREELKGRNLSFTDIAKRVGENWQVLGPDAKDAYETQAARAKERYNAELLNYKKTDDYREYCQYLADFKIKHSTLHPEGKRPKMQSEQSTSTSSTSASANSNDGSAASSIALAHGRHRADSVIFSGQYPVAGGHSSPANVPSSAMIGNPIGRIGTLSPASTSPTPPTQYREAILYTPFHAAHVHATSEDASHESNHGLSPSSHALPRIFPVDGRDQEITKGEFPSLVTDVILTGRRSDSRRSFHISAPLVHQDTSGSSRTSGSTLSSQISEGGTLSSYGSYTSMIPVEESRGQRSLPAPQSMPINTPLSGDAADRIQLQPLQAQTRIWLPSSSTALHTLQPQYQPPSRSPELRQERQSLQNLSLAGNQNTHPECAQNTRPRSRDLTDAPERAHQPPQLASSHLSYSSQHGQASPQEGRRSLLREASPTDTYLDSPTTTDPLSVLAYAGRLVDRDSRRSPRSPSATQ